MNRNILKYFAIPLALASILGVVAFSPDVSRSLLPEGVPDHWASSNRANIYEGCENAAPCVEWCVVVSGRLVGSGQGCCQAGLEGSTDYGACSNLRNIN